MEKIVTVLLERYLMKPEYDAVAESLYHAALQLIGEWLRLTPTDPVIHGLVHTITVSFGNPEFQVTEALEATGYSLDHIRRRFQQAMGMTPIEYLKQVRLQYAKRLLRQRGRLHFPINEIALMCGYYDPAYFCRLFRKETGRSPSEYARGAADSGERVL
ncbi:MAG: helix-turn-helix transcriptional regulator [Oscillospiraceae bacterium]|nr:helix-turn-helix transcriptional regulator [Oscillospiraceae bacterium]